MIHRRTILAAGVAAPFLAACATARPEAGAGSTPDPHSHARPDEARVRHVSLDLAADFERTVMRGAATLTIAARPGAREIVLDIDRLNIRSVRASGRDLPFTIGDHAESIGAPLTIQLGSARVITIEYETSPEAGALQWLSPSQTASNKPFLFTQGQAILTRTWIPTQDSPGVRQTFDARIVAPEGLRAVMGAEMLTPEGGREGNVYRFRMRDSIPPYLIALAIGDLQFRSVGPRTGVYAEPSVIDAAAFECADMERMLTTTEALYGAYRWGRYDVLVLPPSFPFGGMENPCLTFLTPTFIAGDRSLVSLIAHELAHSWSGNLVTNAVWADFWLNEGFTTYIEGRIVEALYGGERAAMQYALSWAEIQSALQTLPEDKQRLHLPGERDAEDYSASIVYEKGALFLRTLERIAGRERFDAYLRSYFDRHAYQPMTTARFLQDFRERLVRGDAALAARMQLDQWAYAPGLPSNAQEPHSAAFDRVAEAVAAFVAGGPAPAEEWSTWGTFERQRFLQTLPRELPRERLDAVASALRLNELGNDEVLFDWLALAIRNGYEPATSAIESFLTRQGRIKFVRPLYRALMDKGEWGQSLARRIYARARPTYHSILVERLDQLMTAG